MMKKKLTVISICILFILIVLLPVGIVVSALFGYTFTLANYSITAIFTAVFAIGTVALDIATKCEIKNEQFRGLTILATPLSLINGAFYYLTQSDTQILISMFVCVCCCCYFTVKYGKPYVLKVISLMLTSLMIFPLVIYGTFVMTFNDFSKNTVVQSVNSPNGTYYAELISKDDGALGGATLVKVYRAKELNMLIFKLSQKPQTVFSGDWESYKYLKISWKDENVLLINSAEYNIDL